MFPLSSLTLSGNTLYGMTNEGGTYNNGTIFSIYTNGSGYKDLYNFANDSISGGSPGGNLTLSGNTLYGMTVYGGSHNAGIIFSIYTNGSGYKDLYSFADNSTSGSNPTGSLTLSGNTLYGMTYKGGIYNNGTIFSIYTNGSGYKDLYIFAGNSTSGSTPYGSLTLSGNTLYGMTYIGGSHEYGTIFSIYTNGTGYNDLYNFAGASGAGPFGSLTLSGNTLYGMTIYGGNYNAGTIFSIYTNGSGYKDLYIFAGNSTSGSTPYGSLTLSGNTLYGMTSSGGGYDNGTIFRINLGDVN